MDLDSMSVNHSLVSVFLPLALIGVVLIVFIVLVVLIIKILKKYL